MRITRETVADERDWIRDRAPVIVPLINEARAALGELFDVDVGTVDSDRYRREVDAVFADGDRAVNVVGYVVALRELDVADDYPGFVVDEVLGRELAATIAGEQPLATLAEATFHYVDSHVHYADARPTDSDWGDEDADATHATHATDAAGLDDLDAALAAGFQTRLPGWEWRETESPFSIES